MSRFMYSDRWLYRTYRVLRFINSDEGYIGQCLLFFKFVSNLEL